MTNVQFLFDMGKLLKRPTPDQSQFETENYELLKSLPESVYTAFEMTRNEMKDKDPLSMNFLWFANSMNGNVLAVIGKSHRQFIRPTGRKNYSLMLKPNYECYIKKLAENTLLPSYNHTNTSAAMCEQFAMPEQSPLPVIFIGYTLSKTNDKVTGCYAVCIKGKERLWVSDLSSLYPPASGNNFILPNTPIMTHPEVEVKVRVKKKAQ